MTLPELCIKRPVLATVMNLVVILVGLIAWDRLGVREYPNIDEPVVTVETRYEGASAEIMESQVTQPLEESLAGIEGIELISSISREESSQITVRFKVTRDIENAANDVRDRVGRTRDFLPDEVDEPVVAKVEADAQPIIYLAFSSSRHNAMEVTDYADRYIKDRLQTLPGVADVRILGERRFSMRVWLDRARLSAYDLTPQDIEDALRRQNVEIPAGRIESTQREFTVLSETDLRTEEQFRDLIIKNEDGYLVRLRDVADVEIGPENERLIVRFNGESAVGLGVVKQSVANPLEISKALRDVLPSVEQSLPEGMQIDIAYDSSVFIDKSIEAVYHTIIEAIVLVMLVVFVFLRTLRATFIPLVTIPVSLAGAVAMMYFFGFSINTLTLLAMVLAIGLVVDDAIVMLENIHRHIEDGMKPMQAALQGSREIAFAIIAMSVTLAAVYTPIAFMEGRTGRLFTEFALALAGAVLISGFVALTLTPMMSSRILRHQKTGNLFYRVTETFFTRINDGYRFLLTLALKARPLVLLAGLAVAAAGGWLFTLLPSELAPVEDRGVIIGIGVAPEGATADYTDKYVRQIEQMYQGVPEIEKYFTVTGFPLVTQAISFARLSDWEERERKQQAVAESLMPQMFGGIPGIMAFPTNPPSLGQRPGEKPVQFVILSTAPYETLESWVNELTAAAREYPGMTAVDSDLRLNKPRLAVSVNREKAATLGIDVNALGRTLETMLGGRQVTRFKRDGEQYDVIVQVADEDRESPQDIANIYVRSASGEMVPLSNLVTVEETVAPKELNHFNRLRSATVNANLTEGTSLGDALAYLEEKSADILPASAQIDYAGQSREFMQSSASLYFTFLLSLAFIFLVLSAQFESFTDPLIIMLTVPLTMTGALLALYLTGGSLNVYSQIGLVTLVGLITKHGILIVEFGNQMQHQGKHRVEAITEAASLRLRPILMTTGAMVLGSLPLALSSGAGAESRSSIGWVIVGGLLVGTFFTLFVIPAVYTYLSRRKWQDAETVLPE
ncbi:MAG: efflux RND transporter permease subunit [Alphaproteobacteria bacterium]|nr:efflux RND transporter permease subunit [Alphaproteobacteria bacterium]